MDLSSAHCPETSDTSANDTSQSYTTELGTHNPTSNNTNDVDPSSFISTDNLNTTFALNMLERLTNKVQTLLSENQTLKSDCITKSKAAAQCNTKSLAIERQLSETVVANEKLTQNNEELKEQLEQQYENHNGELEKQKFRFEQALAKKQEFIDSLNQKLEQLGVEMYEKQTKLDDQAGIVEKLKKELTNSQRLSNELEESIDSVVKSKQTATTQISELERDVDFAKEKITKMEDIISKQRDTIASLKRISQSKSDQIIDLEKRELFASESFQKLSNQCSDSARKEKELLNTIDQLEHDLKILKDDNCSLRQLTTKLGDSINIENTSVIANQEREIESLNTQLMLCSEESVKSANQKAFIEKELEMIKSTYKLTREDLNSRKAEMSATIQHCKSENAILKQHRQEHDKEKSILMERNQSLQEQIKKSSEECHRLRQSINNFDRPDVGLIDCEVQSLETRIDVVSVETCSNDIFVTHEIGTQVDQVESNSEQIVEKNRKRTSPKIKPVEKPTKLKRSLDLLSNGVLCICMGTQSSPIVSCCKCLTQYHSKCVNSSPKEENFVCNECKMFGF
ncbi:hypothetical protein P9112_012574 [Eukaryota sp. TZLM1-RC]